ncbi:MAG: hypothetical protein HUU11_07200 [Anaerolineales bacterium]|nr:hypothetical protein [Anaerolineales bacterium]NUQ84482.1 hypothetical protein [Anaerolineales bacterium]
MLDKLSETSKKYANGWLVFVLLAGFLSFNAVILPRQEVKIKSASGGTGPIDLQLFYTPEKVYSMVASYGEEGRAAYRTFELTGDILYPIIYTLFFALAITWLFQRGFPGTSGMHKFNIVPFGAWLFDLFENLGIVAMLSVYPSTPALLAWLSAIFTLVKWLFAGASVLLMLVGLIMAVRNGFKKQT